MKTFSVLVVDDEPDMLQICRDILRSCTLDEGKVEVATESDPRRAAVRIGAERPDVLFVDLRMPDVSGLELARMSREQDPDRPVVLLTGYPSIETAVEAVRQGAFDYITKPFAADHIKSVLLRALDHRRQAHDGWQRRPPPPTAEEGEPYLGVSEAVRDLLETADRFGASEANILIVGETGTGKTLLAQRIHGRSARRESPFVQVDCGALSETLLESELFGHEKGAFTGAVSSRHGLLAAAAAGSFFLDDVCALPLRLQSKLLGVLQERWFRRVGGNQSIRVDARFIAASNQPPEQEVRSGRLREDLFFRLNILRLDVPPLRARPEDVPILAEAFLRRFGVCRGVDAFAPDALAALRHWSWAGNVRELRNVIERACVLADREVTLDHLPAAITALSKTGGRAGGHFDEMRAVVMAEFERLFFLRLCKTSGGNISRAARDSGLSRNTIYRYIAKHGLDFGTTHDPHPEADPGPDA